VGVTYLDLWRGLLERVADMPNRQHIEAALHEASTIFVESHNFLPDLSGKVYKGLKPDRPAGKPVAIWDDSAMDDSATERSNKSDPSNYTPRWMTINAGHRVCNRIRLVYSLTAPFQKEYLKLGHH
jgi:hypothetical protein